MREEKRRVGTREGQEKKKRKKGGDDKMRRETSRNEKRGDRGGRGEIREMIRKEASHDDTLDD